MRKIGLDVGDKTVGIAVSDELGYTAQGLMTLERVGIRKDTGKILDLVKEYNCDTIVIGLNKKLDGSDSIQTEKVQEFRTMLENKMRSTGMKGIEIVWQDERFTTVMAERVLIDADVSRQKKGYRQAGCSNNSSELSGQSQRLKTLDKKQKGER